MNLLISNIQRLCIHDGPGLRTTVFLMGCPLRCFWCCNPENLTLDIKRCNVGGHLITYGKEYSEDELFEQIIKDVVFYEEGGGVTFSGGEPILQLHNHKTLLKRLKDNNINICIETSLSTDKSFLEEIIDYVDFFLVDIKCLNDNSEKILLDTKTYFSNVILLKNKNKNKNTIFRMPVVKGFNDNDSNINLIKHVVHDYKPKELQLFSLHKLGESKYKNLNLEIPTIESVGTDYLEKIKHKIDYPFTRVIKV